MNSEGMETPKRANDFQTIPSFLETEQPMLPSREFNDFKEDSFQHPSINEVHDHSKENSAPRLQGSSDSSVVVVRQRRRSKTANFILSTFHPKRAVSGMQISTEIENKDSSFHIKNREELSHSAVFEREKQKKVRRESDSPELKKKSAEENIFTSKAGDIIFSKKRGILKLKPTTYSVTFDALMDQMKGSTSILSNYPSHKIDKRLIFLGKDIDSPWHLISYHSTFRKCWNFFIVTLILLELFWYPVDIAFIPWEPWPLGCLIFELICIPIFVLDILINIRTTYSNENNEEIVDSKMIRRNYLFTKLFFVDLITVLPIPEVLLLVLIGSDAQWLVYSAVVMIRMLRVFKLPSYLQNQVFIMIAKLLRIFIFFFIGVHWITCIWYVIVKADFANLPTDISVLWLPNTTRMIASDDTDLLEFYFVMDIVKVYGLTLLAVMMLAVGSDMAPQGDLQLWVTIAVGLFGAAVLAYIFGLVNLSIDQVTKESREYQSQNEELKQKLKVNQVPHNLRVKVMEYFSYIWRKNNVLKKMNDFSELSLPLQRDIALYQNQEMLLNVPLFKELDPIEILSIVQKLKTAIYMPGDKIYREGEKGTEMFFVQEGVVEKVLKKVHPNNGLRVEYERTLLQRGRYFGEVALISNAKRSHDVNAFEFCILYSFSRNDYNSLKVEFKDIGPRLRSGLKHYKNTHVSSLTKILKNLDIFKGFREHELQRIADEYLEEVFVDPEKVVLAPKERTNAIYIVLGGKINCYENNEQTQKYLSHLRRSHGHNNWTVVDIDQPEDVGCFDDDIPNLEKDKVSMEADKSKLNLVKIYNYGEYFGALDFHVNEIACNYYYVTERSCQIGAITQTLKSQMANEDPILYEKLKANIRKIYPTRIKMGDIQEESDSSFSTKNNTLPKIKLNKRFSIVSEVGKRPNLIKIMSLNQNKEDDPTSVKEELAQLGSEMHRFRTLIGNINTRLASIVGTHYKGGKSDEVSPERRRSLFTRRPSTNILDQIKLIERLSPNKELAKELLGVDEVDQNEESKSLEKED